ncbi:hypothetical protein LU631_17035 [Erwinia tracheiphila]|uniref:Uncharacterized protein n=1 Tax=Erwinia tracheiphila TaxID=65700 RepID=A0A0M2KD99_9GAMM|nr:hypothetical protein [Erwinia tracheiphila]EOS96574.1 hypothetical protein ETR_02139 [Erwinia tracheiphila PSU-1]KKF34941.1 hypothetical protein SY86_05115 [Erwinia tracheiphila]UIA86610.1 hypothetical protein LU631_17035 [Erwinia tracheiphila]UIA94963.1 hypothetical protein LU633_15495 [Erwinia tracheiphila]
MRVLLGTAAAVAFFTLLMAAGIFEAGQTVTSVGIVVASVWLGSQLKNRALGTVIGAALGVMIAWGVVNYTTTLKQQECAEATGLAKAGCRSLGVQ